MLSVRSFLVGAAVCGWTLGGAACALIAGLGNREDTGGSGGRGESGTTATGSGAGTTATTSGPGSTSATASTGVTATSTSSASSASSASSGGTGGSGGGGPLAGFPDSATKSCYDGTNITTTCPAAGMTGAGQDCCYDIVPPKYAAGPGANLVNDLRTGLTWWASNPGTFSVAEATSTCTNLVIDGGGFRLASRLELVSLLDLGATGARIDQASFTKITPGDYWTSTVYGTENVIVNFGCLTPGPSCMTEATTFTEYPGNPHGILCVKGPTLTAGPFTSQGAGIIVDGSTGLSWQAAISQNGSTWAGALVTCHQAVTGGFTDWRAPNRKELETIVDDANNGATVAAFAVPPNTGPLWSSTPSSEVPDRFYAVDSNAGFTTLNDHTIDYLKVRCVRGGSGGP